MRGGGEVRGRAALHSGRCGMGRPAVRLRKSSMGRGGRTWERGCQGRRRVCVAPAAPARSASTPRGVRDGVSRQMWVRGRDVDVRIVVEDC
jgi:hypothetical protein